MIRCAVFDFDGTLVHSNDIKRRGFFEILGPDPDGLTRMTAILADPPGDRTEIIAAYARASGANASALLADYTRWTGTEILNCPLRAGANEILAALTALGVTIYVNSFTPREHLVPAVEGLFGADVFDGIYGGHGQKEENLRTIIETNAYRPGEIVVVGDGIDDHDSAIEVGTRFVGVNGGTLEIELPDTPMLQNLSDVAAMPGMLPAAAERSVSRHPASRCMA
jgi:phosphoglycolate phosphatase